MIYYKLGNDFFSKLVRRQFGENHFIPKIGLVLVLPLKKDTIKKYLEDNKVITVIIV